MFPHAAPFRLRQGAKVNSPKVPRPSRPRTIPSKFPSDASLAGHLHQALPWRRTGRKLVDGSEPCGAANRRSAVEVARRVQEQSPFRLSPIAAPREAVKYGESLRL